MKDIAITLALLLIGATLPASLVADTTSPVTDTSSLTADTTSPAIDTSSLVADTLPLVVDTTSPATNISIGSIGGMIGIANPLNENSNSGGRKVTFGAMGIYRITSRIGIGLGVDFWSKTEDKTVCNVEVESKISNICVNAVARYSLITSPHPIQPFIETGVGMNMLKASVKTSLGTESVDDNRVGIHFSGGLMYCLPSGLALSGEIKYAVIDSYNTLFLTGGLAYAFGGVY